MNEETLNISLRKFLKKVGVTGQREIEQAIRAAIDSRKLAGNEKLDASVQLRMPGLALDVKIDGQIELE